MGIRSGTSRLTSRLTLSVLLSDNRSLDFAQGGAFFTVYPKRSFLPGERVKLTVRFGIEPAPEYAAFWLVGHVDRGARRVEVFHQSRSTDIFQRECVEARAEANQCQEDKARLLAERTDPGGLMGTAWLEQTGKTHSKDIPLDLKQQLDNVLTAEVARSYSHSGRVAVSLQLFNSGPYPWAAVVAVLKNPMGAETGLSVWQEKIIAPGARDFIGVGADKEAGQLGCPCTLELREPKGTSAVILGNVTFPESRALNQNE